MADVPDERARAAAPPSKAAMRFSKTSWVGFIKRVYIFPGSFHKIKISYRFVSIGFTEALTSCAR